MAEEVGPEPSEEQRSEALRRLFDVEAPVDDWEAMEAEIDAGRLGEDGEEGHGDARLP